MVTSQITSGSIYFPIIFTLFTFILVSNLIGNIPYSFAITSHLIFTIGMSVAILIGVTIIGFKIHG
jgi:F0F1-type ATP synthase membrane subunit a